MPRLIDADAIALQVQRNLMPNVDDCGVVTVEDAERYFLRLLDKAPAVDAVPVVRCRDCVHAVPLDKHCELNASMYMHCGLLRGDLTKYVWHKYKKYYKDYSLVERDDFCSYGKRKDGDGA